MQEKDAKKPHWLLQLFGGPNFGNPNRRFDKYHPFWYLVFCPFTVLLIIPYGAGISATFIGCVMLIIYDYHVAGWVGLAYHAAATMWAYEVGIMHD